jgi:hypothetical protein
MFVVAGKNINDSFFPEGCKEPDRLNTMAGLHDKRALD